MENAEEFAAIGRHGNYADMYPSFGMHGEFHTNYATLPATTADIAKIKKIMAVYGFDEDEYTIGKVYEDQHQPRVVLVHVKYGFGLSICKYNGTKVKAFIKGTPIDLASALALREQYRNHQAMTRMIEELRQEIDQLRQAVYYAPGGAGYDEAKSHFESAKQ